MSDWPVIEEVPEPVSPSRVEGNSQAEPALGVAVHHIGAGDESFHSPHTAAVWAPRPGSSVNVTLALPFPFRVLIIFASALPK